jgi:hypothetical protein
MPSERHRLLELALESLHAKRKQLDEEIDAITRELRGRGTRKSSESHPNRQPKAGKGKKPRFTKEERLRRSQRMKAYWEKWRKDKAKKKK